METVISQTKVSVREFREMLFDDTDDFYYEIIDGEMIRKSAPSPMHQEVSRNLLYLLETVNRQHQKGSLFYAPIDVYLDEFNKPQPDLVFISKEKSHLVTSSGIEGVPDLIIEIISPSSVIRDRIEKKNVYERVGVHEFWLVDPRYESIEIYTLQDGRYQLYSGATTFEGVLKSETFPELTIELRGIFAETA